MSTHIRTTLVTLTLLCCSAGISAADNVWCMVTPDGQAIAMSEVGYILSLGSDSETFTIVCTNNAVVENVSKVTFQQTTPTAIARVNAQAGDVPVLSRQATGELSLLGCRAGMSVRLYSATGTLMQSLTTDGNPTVISVDSLPRGIYLLNVGQTTIKFMKE